MDDVLKGNKSMIRHIVCWKFKDEAEGLKKAEIISTLEEKLSNLTKQMPYVLSFEFGKGLNDSGDFYDASIVMDFASKEDLLSYQNDPRHVEISEFVKKARLSRACVDYDTNK